MTMREYGSDREYPANDCLSKQEQVMDIHIKPKMRYLVVSAFIPVVVYLGAFFLSFYLPPGYHWALQVLVGISINKEKLADAETVIDCSSLLDEKYLLVQRGKKNYYLLIAK